MSWLDLLIFTTGISALVGLLAYAVGHGDGVAQSARASLDKGPDPPEWWTDAVTRARWEKEHEK
jgi:hypothetical protein